MQTIDIKEDIKMMFDPIHLFNQLMELHPKPRWVERSDYGHRGHGYMFYPKDRSAEILADVIALVGNVVTPEGHGCVPPTREDYQLCFSMLKEKYKL